MTGWTRDPQAGPKDARGCLGCAAIVVFAWVLIIGTFWALARIFG